MNIVKMGHQWGTWNLWNLFPHNILGIFNYMILNKYSGLCLLETLATCVIELLNIKCLEKVPQVPHPNVLAAPILQCQPRVVRATPDLAMQNIRMT